MTIAIKPDTNYPDMYRLHWSDGTFSTDFYNLTRAKELAKVLEKRRLKKGKTYYKLLPTGNIGSRS